MVIMNKYLCLDKFFIYEKFMYIEYGSIECMWL